MIFMFNYVGALKSAFPINSKQQFIFAVVFLLPLKCMSFSFASRSRKDGDFHYSKKYFSYVRDLFRKGSIRSEKVGLQLVRCSMVNIPRTTSSRNKTHYQIFF